MIRKLTFSQAALAVAAALALSGPARAISAPGFTVTEIPLSDVAAGDVVVVGGALFVGIGPAFVGGSQSVVRIDGDGTTVVAEGFAGLSGFAYDAANDRLVVGDNAAEAPGATTGDTVYEILDPLGTFATPLVANDIELLASGTLPGVADIVLDPDDATGQTLLVTDSTTFDVRRVDLVAGTTTSIQGTTGFAAGLAVDAADLFFGEVQFVGANFVPDGAVSSVALPGTGNAALVTTGLPGQYDLELATDGSLLSTSGDSLLAIDLASGNVTTLATEFGFATGLFERDGTIWALDGGFPGVDVVYELVPVPEPGTAVTLGTAFVAALAALRRHRAGAR
ncbi:MAG: hypothetical protein QNK03_12960 [Myxococcota bacterium]|nr:hypothetical protein [Myxococcota bacterium]